MTERAWTNASDPKQIKRAKRWDQERFKRERADLESLLNTVQGRRFLWRQLCGDGVFRISFVAGDPYSTAFHDGRRSRGLALMAEIQLLNPEYYHLMAKEAHDLDEMTKPGPSEEPTPINPDTEESTDAD